MRRSSAAWQAVSLDRCFREGQCLLAGLSFLARERHPFTDNGASHFHLGHFVFPFKTGAADDCPPYPGQARYAAF
jgi:hypothetical protein